MKLSPIAYSCSSELLGKVYNLNPCSTSLTYGYICMCAHICIHTYICMEICKHTYSCTHIHMCALFALAYLKIWESRVTRLRECKYTNVYMYVATHTQIVNDSQQPTRSVARWYWGPTQYAYYALCLDKKYCSNSISKGNYKYHVNTYIFYDIITIWLPCLITINLN